MKINVALVGNPNVGKTSVFNSLTGLSQKVGNYPGITVDKKTGTCKISDSLTANIIDLPGTYSIKPVSKDEAVVFATLFDQENKSYPDVVVVVAEVENLKRNLLLFTQIKDLGFKTILAINMADQLREKGITVNTKALSAAFKTDVVLLSTRKGDGISQLKESIATYEALGSDPLLDLKEVDAQYFEANPDFKAWVTQEDRGEANQKRLQQKETVKRYQLINDVLKIAYTKDSSRGTGLKAKADRILMHPIWGYVVFFLVMLLVFQAIFSWSGVPMDLIDGFFGDLSEWGASVLPEGKLTDLISQGIIPGIGGVVIFIPQIAILFMFIAILEETGYMSRVVFLMDKLMRPFGLSGKSVVPLISGVACAIPAIMSARNIENTKERLITMLVTPFTTCSARIPVYVIIISLVIPDEKVMGLGLQGLVMTGMYFLGFFVALATAWMLKKMVNVTAKSHFIVEMPSYRMPLAKNVISTMVEKTKAFVWGAGKIILALSILLWFLGSHGPSSTFGNAEEIVAKNFEGQNLSEEQMADELDGYKLRSSYIGMAGSVIEPIFRPLGYDWKISIAVLTSFAAREVFVGNLAILYNIGSSGEEETKIIERMRAEVKPNGKPVFDLATGMSLLMFYALAMQCISTIGIMRRESNSWKWTAFQVAFMTGLAYVVSFIVYQLLK